MLKKTLLDCAGSVFPSCSIIRIYASVPHELCTPLKLLLYAEGFVLKTDREARDRLSYHELNI